MKLKKNVQKIPKLLKKNVEVYFYFARLRYNVVCFKDLRRKKAVNPGAFPD